MLLCLPSNRGDFGRKGESSAGERGTSEPAPRRRDDDELQLAADWPLFSTFSYSLNPAFSSTSDPSPASRMSTPPPAGPTPSPEMSAAALPPLAGPSSPASSAGGSLKDEEQMRDSSPAPATADVKQETADVKTNESDAEAEDAADLFGDEDDDDEQDDIKMDASGREDSAQPSQSVFLDTAATGRPALTSSLCYLEGLEVMRTSPCSPTMTASPRLFVSGGPSSSTPRTARTMARSTERPSSRRRSRLSWTR